MGITTLRAQGMPVAAPAMICIPTGRKLGKPRSSSEILWHPGDQPGLIK